MIEKLKEEIASFMGILEVSIKKIEADLDEKATKLEELIKKEAVEKQKNVLQFKQKEEALASERKLIDKEKPIDEERKRRLDIKERALKEKSDKIQRLFDE